MIAVLGDIHANLAALREVLTFCERRGVTEYYSVGDVVGYYAFPRECLALLDERDARIAQGNHDAAVAFDVGDDEVVESAAQVFAWTRRVLDTEQLDHLRNLPMSFTAGTGEAAFRVVHAAVVRPWTWPYVKQLDSAVRLLHAQDVPICFYGHTHMPMCFSFDGDFRAEDVDRIRIRPEGRYLINVGSVGQPRDGDYRAQVVTFDPTEALVELHRIEYDITATVNAQLAEGLPRAPLDYLQV